MICGVCSCRYDQTDQMMVHSDDRIEMAREAPATSNASWSLVKAAMGSYKKVARGLVPVFRDQMSVEAIRLISGL